MHGPSLVRDCKKYNPTKQPGKMYIITLLDMTTAVRRWWLQHDEKINYYKVDTN